MILWLSRNLEKVCSPERTKKHTASIPIASWSKFILKQEFLRGQWAFWTPLSMIFSIRLPKKLPVLCNIIRSKLSRLAKFKQPLDCYYPANSPSMPSPKEPKLSQNLLAIDWWLAHSCLRLFFKFSLNFNFNFWS